MRADIPEVRGTLQRTGINSDPIYGIAPPIVNDVLHSMGQPLDATTRAFMEPRFGHDFSNVRVHTDDRAAASTCSVNALAYTVGNHVAFNTGQYRPESSDGRLLLAHELAHVVQQDGSATSSTTVAPAESAHEDAATRLAHDVNNRDTRLPNPQESAHGLQRTVQFRDVGRGEQSGFALLPDLIARLNAFAGGLTYSLAGNDLAYERRDGAELSGFDQQMMEFIDLPAVIPLRLTNRHGLLGTRATGFRDQIEADAWESGYVDIDDLLASTDLGLQFLLAHFIRERAETRNYARRIGTSTFTDPEFNRVHGQGIEAEARLLRDFFGDPTIRFLSESAGQVYRVFRNDRGDQFRARMRRTRNVDAVSIEVRTPDGRVLTPEEYLNLLRAERTRDQVQRERLGGATEYRAGVGGVPAP